MHMAFLDFEKAYDLIDSEGLCKVLQVYKLGGKLLAEYC